MRTPQPVFYEVVPPRTAQRLSSGRGGEVNVWFNRCIKGKEPNIFELWAFAEDGAREVQPYARVQMSSDFTGETFQTQFFNAREVRITFLGHRYVNRSVQWRDVPQPFGKTGIATDAWAENLYVYPWGTNPTRITNVPIIRRTTFLNVPINLRAVARHACNNCLWNNRVERRKTLQRELHAQILLDIRDEVLSDDSDEGYIEELSDW